MATNIPAERPKNLEMSSKKINKFMIENIGLNMQYNNNQIWQKNYQSGNCNFQIVVNFEV